MPADIPAHPDGQTMKAVVFSSFSKDTSALSVKTIPKPTISEPTQVLIKVKAAALNPIDKVRVAGGLKMFAPEKYKHSVIGYDCAGIVEEVGDKVEKFHVGDKVHVRLGIMKYGSSAQYAVAEEVEVAKKPENISFNEAAGIPLAGLTAYQSLRAAGAKEGSKVFITGGTGGVGSLAIQIARHVFGAKEVVTTARSGASTDLCKELGADRVVDYKSSKFEEVLKGEDFDVGFDTTNESHRFAPLMKKGGKVTTVAGAPTVEAITGAAKFGKPNLIVRGLLWLIRNRKAENSLKKVGASWEYIFMKPLGADLEVIDEKIADGSIRPVVHKIAPSIEEFDLAAKELWGGSSKGKCIIAIDGDDTVAAE